MEKNKGAAANALCTVKGVQPPTYTEIGISYNLASEAQVLATLPESDQNDVISGVLCFVVPSGIDRKSVV